MSIKMIMQSIKEQIKESIAIKQLLIENGLNAAEIDTLLFNRLYIIAGIL